MSPMIASFALGLFISVQALGQISTLPYVQHFDSVQAPELPPGWSSTQNRLPGTNDFLTTVSVPRSVPNALVSTNATIEQALFSPQFDFSAEMPDSIMFFTRRSGSHGARVVVEASLDAGTTFSVFIGDTLRNGGSTAYIPSAFSLPPVLASSSVVVFRWRILPDPSGTTGTFRLDDLIITVQRSYDLSMISLAFVPVNPIEGEGVVATAGLFNGGQQPADTFAVAFYADANADSLPQQSELITVTTNTDPLSVRDSTHVEGALGRFMPTAIQIIAAIVYGRDQDSSNDKIIAPLIVGYPAHSLVVNELMYAPGGSEPEWIELYNTRNDTIDLNEWRVSDSNINNKRSIADSTTDLLPRGFILLTRDSAALHDVHPEISVPILTVAALPTLNNSGDAVVVYDNRGVTMDSLMYMPSWGGNNGGRSLERIDPLGPSAESENWGSSHHSSGSTPGRKNSLARKDFDLSIDTFLIAPVNPVLRDSLTFHVQITNIGIEPSSPFVVVLYEDANMDSVPQPGELLVSSVADSLAPLSSSSFAFTLFRSRAGSASYIAEAKLPADEDTTNNVAILSASVGVPAGSIRINEIMYAPVSGIPEWVELMNVSPDTVDLEEWKLGNRTTSRYAVDDSLRVLLPSQLVVIAKDSALMLQAYGPIQSPLVQSPSLPTFLWNNLGDAVVLVDDRGVLMDSVFYSSGWGGSLGSSLERIDILGDPNDSTNWASSEDSLNATPGRSNSVEALDYDLKALHADSVSAPPGTPLDLMLVIKNIGKNAVSAFAAAFYDDNDNDSVASPNERIGDITITHDVSRYETLAVHYLWQSPEPGRHNVIARIILPEDQRVLNNDIRFQANVSYTRGTIVVNEIMYSPLSGNAEYVELTNVSERDVDLFHWHLKDRPATSGQSNSVAITEVPRVLHPKEFFVVSSDSTILLRYPFLSEDSTRVTIVHQTSLSLNNDGDDVVITDVTGAVIDSVAFLPSWHNPGVVDNSGRSLEKISPSLASQDQRSWSSCTLPIGGTPGRQNSIFASVMITQAALSFNPNPFSPDGDGFEDFTLIQYSIPLQVSTLRISIFDVRGRRIRTLVNDEPGSVYGKVVWDGRDDDGRIARVGIYIVFVEAINDAGGVLETTKGLVVLATKL